MASGGLGNLTVDLLLETLQWTTGLNKAEHEAEKFAEAIGSKFEQMGARALDSLKKLAAGAVAGFAVERVVSFVNETQKAADALDEMAQKTGASLQFLAQMSVTADMSGTSIEGVAAAMGKFNKATAEAFKDSQSGPAKAFQELGISVTDTAGKLKSSEALFLEASAALSKIEDAAIRSATAQALFGKSGAELLPMMMSLANQSAELAAASKAYGDEMARLAPIAGALEEQQTIATTNAKTLAAVIGEQLIPYTTELIKVWNGAAESGGSLARSCEILMNAFKGVILSVDAIVTTFVQLLTVLSGVADALNLIKVGQFAAAADAMKVALKDAAHQGEMFETRLKAMADPLSTVNTKAAEASVSLRTLDSDLKNATSGLAGGIARTVEEWVKLIDKKIEGDAILANGKWADAQVAAAKKAAEAYKKTSAAWVEYIEQVQAFEAKGSLAENEIVRAREARERAELTRREEGIRTAADAEARIIAEAMEAKAKYLEGENAKVLKTWEDQYGEFYKGIDSAGRAAFDSLFSGTEKDWGDMMVSLKNAFKRTLLDYLYNAFAKPFIMKFAASITGQPGAGGASGGGGFGGLGDMASQAYNYYSQNYGAASYLEGGSNFMGPMPEGYVAAANTGGLSQLSWTSNAGGAWGGVASAGAGVVGGAFGGWAAGAYGAGERGQAAAQNYAAMGATIGMQVYGPIGAVVGAVIGTIAGIATDPDPDAMRKAVFGQITEHTQGVTPWTGESAFGKFGFSEGEWLSDEQMGESMTRAVAGIAAMDNALAQFMSEEQIANVTARLAEASKKYELGMEHLDVQGIGAVITDRLYIVASEFNEALGDFVKGFKGTVEDLTTIVVGYFQATSLAENFDPEAILEATKPRAFMDVYQEGRGGLEEFIGTMDTSAESMTALVGQMLAFQNATVQMIAAIDAAAAAMHDMFMSTADKIKLSVMTPEERYNYLQAQTEELYKQLETETDPAQIQALAAKINANINAAWELLTPEQQQAMADSFTTRLTMLDEAVSTKMGALREVVLEDAEAVMTSITERLETVFARADAAATTQQEAADANLAAANTPVQVVVLVSDDGSVKAAG